MQLEGEGGRRRQPLAPLEVLQEELGRLGAEERCASAFLKDSKFLLPSSRRAFLRPALSGLQRETRASREPFRCPVPLLARPPASYEGTGCRQVGLFWQACPL